MKKFGFGKKPDGGDDDGNRNALFGKRGSPAPANNNPYAQAPAANDPYMNEDSNKYANVPPATAYQRARAGLPGGPRPGGGLPSGPGPQSGYGMPPSRSYSSESGQTAPPPYQDNKPSGGFGSEKYGASGGYGGNRYDNRGGYGAPQSNQSSQGAYGGGNGGSRPGGYGGLGGADNGYDDENRDQLFAGARERQQQQRQNLPPQDNAYGQSGADASADDYGGYGERRELTAEEEDEAVYQDTKKQISDITDASLASTTNAKRAMYDALDTGMNTYARLGAQNERLHHTEQLLDQATESHREAEAGTKKLKSLNRSMFAVHVKNPFTAKARTAEEEARILSQNQSDREIRESTRQQKFAQEQRMEQNFGALNKEMNGSSFPKRSQGRNKYMLEEDSDDENRETMKAKNTQIEDDLDEMSAGVRRMKMLGMAMGEELDSSNKLIDRIGSKTDPLDDQLRVTNARLNRIR